METNNILVKDLRVKKYYYFVGKYIRHSMWCAPCESPAKGIICETSQYIVDEIAKDKRKYDHYFDNVLLDNEEFYHSVHIEYTKLRPALENEITAFNATLASRNLEIRECQTIFRTMAGDTLERCYELQFIDPSAIPFRVGEQDLTRAEFEALEIPQGKSLLYYYDNGYSYMGVQPTTKEKYLEAVDRLIYNSHLLTDWQGVQLTRKTAKDPYVVNVRIGKNKSYSEISNS